MKSFAQILCFVLFVALTACQTTPTKVTSKHDVPIDVLMKNLDGPVQLTEQTVVVDVRAAFEYTMAHLPGAVNLRWDQFTQSKGPSRGLLLDEGEIARRLAIYGITPETPVVVVGDGVQGSGEAGRMAWMLYYLGVKDVQMVDIDYFGGRITHIQEGPTKNAVPWAPNLRPSVLATEGEVKRVISNPQELGRKTFLIDVRSKEEYFAKKGFDGGYASPDLRAMHIHWKEFFNSDGRPEMNMKDRLMAVGVDPEARIIVVSQKGVRSGAVTMALLSLGFSRAANFAGGLDQLL